MIPLSAPQTRTGVLDQLTDAVDSVLAPATEALGNVSDKLYGGLLIWLLVGIGLYFTVRTDGVQLRHFPNMVRTILVSRSAAHEGISSFQAFAVGIASRVGTGNIIGVAIAITMGGPSAVFWMWMVALVGMATGFVESTLAQMYKIPNPDGSFRGGPAYYIQRGLGSKAWASIFAVVITFVFGFAYEATQANAISTTLKSTFNISPWITAVLLVLITGPIIFNGIRLVARVAEWLAPIMAMAYVILAAVVLLLNLDAIPGIMMSFVKDAFSGDVAFYGISGGLYAAAINGVKRGLFSNEAGQGSVPNVAATATTSHPVHQGFIQSLGVFVDTIIVCTATALIVLLSGVYDPARAALDPDAARVAAGSLTSTSVAEVLGPWSANLMAAIIFVFAYSSLLGNFTYAEINIDFLRGGAASRAWRTGLRVMILVAAFVGSVAELTFVWNLSDVAMGLMAIINIVAIALLGKWAFGALRDWEAQNRAVREGRQSEIRFIATDNPYLPGALPGDVWAADGAAHRGASAAGTAGAGSTEGAGGETARA
ncbi:alanine/glycine:cation symporter family protein [Actinomyces bowdenii]|uniref:alanine/glycine:cation symporter family protein n=1 Tax=Actinomyces bowdenii TaxID=131109 RepID=UPI0035A2927E